MSQKTMNIFVIGVGGQGIGLLSEALIRAFDAAGHPVRGVDTHGLAQRGGTVVSNIRVGPGAHSPLVRPGRVDLAIALERHEGLRALQTVLADGGALAYYDAEWQPLQVRLGKNEAVTPALIEDAARQKHVRVFRVSAELPDVRMQNVALLAHLVKHHLLGSVTATHTEKALSDLLQGSTLEKNLDLFRKLTQ